MNKLFKIIVILACVGTALISCKKNLVESQTIEEVTTLYDIAKYMTKNQIFLYHLHFESLAVC